MRTPELLQALREVSNEVERAQSIYGPFASAHEGYAVLLEEVDELKAEVWKSPKKRDYDAMMTEACQVAAMAIRLMIEIASPKVIKVDTIKRAKFGDASQCSSCGERIVFVDPHWDHTGENKPRHPAVPVEYTV